jgi:calcineurin-like phosphoesterase family protein
MKYWSSDWHLGHGNVIRFLDRPFESVQEMNDTILKNMFSPLKKGDEFFFLGDLSWSKSAYQRVFDELPSGVSFHWLLGNHDLKEYKKWEFYCTSISELKHIKVKGITIALCHYPMVTWNKSHFNSYMLFGHHHAKGHGIQNLQQHTEGKMLNVNCEFNDYKPYSENDIIRIMENKPNNWDLIEKDR